MKITIKKLSKEASEKNDWLEHYRLDINDKEILHVSDGSMEPEDALLGRDLNFVYNIPSWMKQAYEAGKNGEELLIERVTIEDSEEMWDE